MARGWGIRAVTAAGALGGVDAGAWALSDCARIGPPCEHTASHKASVHTENLLDIFTPPHVMLITSLRRIAARNGRRAAYTTALRLATSRNHCELSLGVRCSVFMSVRHSPNLGS